LLPDPAEEIRLVKYGDDSKLVGSLPFCVNDLNITSSGGLDSSRIVWAHDRSNSG
jgi:hypothetical protein